jgi:DNA invertase Pin-like site-specific DNA recombinase
MHFYGYARVSTTDQDLTIQREALKAAGCKVIREEKVSGTSRQGRVELDTLLQFIRKGDTLVCTRIDRLARSVADLQDIVRLLREKGANLLATEQKVDTSTAAGKAFFDMLGVFAEFETNLRKERQMEGIAKAKEKGIQFGRKPKLQDQDIEEMRLEREGGAKISELMAKYSISKASVYRLLP